MAEKFTRNSFAAVGLRSGDLGSTYVNNAARAVDDAVKFGVEAKREVDAVFNGGKRSVKRNTYNIKQVGQKIKNGLFSGDEDNDLSIVAGELWATCGDSEPHLINDTSSKYSYTALDFNFGVASDDRHNRPVKWHKSPEGGKYDYIKTMREFEELKELYSWAGTVNYVCNPQIIKYWHFGKFTEKPDFLTIQGHLRYNLKHTKTRTGSNEWFYTKNDPPGNDLECSTTTQPTVQRPYIRLHDEDAFTTGNYYLYDNTKLNKYIENEEKVVFDLLDTMFFHGHKQARGVYEYPNGKGFQWDWNDVLFGTLNPENNRLQPRVQKLVRDPEPAYVTQYVDLPVIVWRWYQGCRFVSDFFEGNNSIGLQMKRYVLPDGLKKPVDAENQTVNCWCEIDITKVLDILHLDVKEWSDAYVQSITNPRSQKLGEAQNQLLQHGIFLTMSSDVTQMGALRSVMDPAYINNSLLCNWLLLLTRVFDAKDMRRLTKAINYVSPPVANARMGTHAVALGGATAIAGYLMGSNVQNTLGASIAVAATRCGSELAMRGVSTVLNQMPLVSHVNSNLLLLGVSIGLCYNEYETISGFADLAQNKLFFKAANQIVQHTTFAARNYIWGSAEVGHYVFDLLAAGGFIKKIYDKYTATESFWVIGLNAVEVTLNMIPGSNMLPLDTVSRFIKDRVLCTLPRGASDQTKAQLKRWQEETQAFLNKYEWVYLNTAVDLATSLYARWQFSKLCGVWYHCAIFMQLIWDGLAAWLLTHANTAKVKDYLPTLISASINVLVGVFIVESCIHRETCIGLLTTAIAPFYSTNTTAIESNATITTDVALYDSVPHAAPMRGITRFIYMSTPAYCWASRWVIQQLADPTAAVDAVRTAITSPSAFQLGYYHPVEKAAGRIQAAADKLNQIPQTGSKCTYLTDAMTALCTDFVNEVDMNLCNEFASFISAATNGTAVFFPKLVCGDTDVEANIDDILSSLFQVHHQVFSKDMHTAGFMIYQAGGTDSLQWKHQNGLETKIDSQLAELDKMKRDSPKEMIVYLKAKLTLLTDNYHDVVDAYRGPLGDFITDWAIKPASWITLLAVQWGASICAILKNGAGFIPGFKVVSTTASALFKSLKAIGSFAVKLTTNLLKSAFTMLNEILESLANWGIVKLTNFRILVDKITTSLRTRIDVTAQQMLHYIDGAMRELEYWFEGFDKEIESEREMHKMIESYEYLGEATVQAANPVVNTGVCDNVETFKKGFNQESFANYPTGSEASAETAFEDFVNKKEVTVAKVDGTGTAVVKVEQTLLDNIQNIAKHIAKTLCNVITDAVLTAEEYLQKAAGWVQNKLGWTDKDVTAGTKYIKDVAMAVVLTGQTHLQFNKDLWETGLTTVATYGWEIFNGAKAKMTAFYEMIMVPFNLMASIGEGTAMFMRRMYKDLKVSKIAMYRSMSHVAKGVARTLAETAKAQYDLSDYVASGDEATASFWLEHVADKNATNQINAEELDTKLGEAKEAETHAISLVEHGIESGNQNASVTAALDFYKINSSTLETSKFVKPELTDFKQAKLSH